MMKKQNDIKFKKILLKIQKIAVNIQNLNIVVCRCFNCYLTVMLSNYDQLSTTFNVFLEGRSTQGMTDLKFLV